MQTVPSTSALAKCYIREPRSLDVLDWADAQDEVVTSPLTLVEFRCVLARRRRAQQIDLPLERVALAEFDRDVQANSWRIQQDAPSLFGASSFATADKHQAEAAKALGLPVAIFY
ncbi:MAG: PIN domain-containing protein [Thiobacillus sp. SCN 63-1177]|nr:MAG: PIN domain-containing protein [Thiobacillus sp. SCN 63-1177]